MANITRLDSNERLSRVVIHGDTVYVAGITSSVKGDIVAQTRDVLGLAISASLNAPIPETRFGVFRM